MMMMVYLVDGMKLGNCPLRYGVSTPNRKSSCEFRDERLAERKVATASRVCDWLTETNAAAGITDQQRSQGLSQTTLYKVYKVLHGCAPSFTYVADLPSRRGLRSSCSDCLVQPPVHRSNVGSRAFSVAWPSGVELSSAGGCVVGIVSGYLPRRSRLETFLFTESYTDIRLI